MPDAAGLKGENSLSQEIQNFLTEIFRRFSSFSTNDLELLRLRFRSTIKEGPYEATPFQACVVLYWPYRVLDGPVGEVSIRKNFAISKKVSRNTLSLFATMIYEFR